MASVYTTKRGKNKKAKLGMRKDAANNQANKLGAKVNATEAALEALLNHDQPKILTLGSSEQRRKNAIAKAQEKLMLTAGDKKPITLNGNGNGDVKPVALNGDKPADKSTAATPSSAEPVSDTTASSSPAKELSKDVCHYPACPKQPSEPNTTSEASPPKLLMCGGCRGSYYCSAECQKAHWPQHKEPCKFVQRAVKQALAN